MNTEKKNQDCISSFMSYGNNTYNKIACYYIV